MAETARALGGSLSERLAAAEAGLAAALERLDAAGRLEPETLAGGLAHLRAAQEVALDAVDQRLSRGLAERMGQIAAALAAGEAGTRLERVTLALEGARQLLRHDPAGPGLWRDRTPRELVQWLAGALEGISQAELADLLGVSTKTVYRWQSGATAAGAGDEDRLRALAALVAQLRGTLTGTGIVRWLRLPRAAGPAPLTLLTDPEQLPALLRDAAALRG